MKVRIEDYIFAFTLVLFCFLKLKVYPCPPYFSGEEVLKLNYLTRLNELGNFFSHFNQNYFFYGHFGIPQFFLMFFRGFTDDILEMRKVILFYHLSLISLIYYEISRILTKSISLFAIVLFIGLPLFVIQSDMMILEIFALGFSIAGVSNYYRKNNLRATCFLLLGTLSLESFIAFPLAIICVETWRKRNQIRTSPKSLALSLIPPFLSVLALFSFFYINLKKRNVFSSHSVVQGGSSFTDQVLSLFQRTNYYTSLTGLWDSFVELKISYLLVLAPLFVFLVFKGISKKERALKPNEAPFLCSFGLAAFIVLLFFILYNHHSGGRDYYAVYFFLMILFGMSLEIRGLKKPLIILTSLALFSINLFNFGNSSENRTATLSSLFYYKQYDDLLSLRNLIKKKVWSGQERAITCHNPNLNSFPRNALCPPFMNNDPMVLFKKPLDLADFAILSPYENDHLIDLVREINQRFKKRERLTFDDSSFYLYYDLR